MSTRSDLLARRRSALIVAFGVLLAVGLALGGEAFVSGGAQRASAQPGSAEAVPQTDASAPAREVTMLGSSPAEAPGETWGVGAVGPQSNPCYTIVRYTTSAGWSQAPGPLDASGQPLAGFQPDQPSASGSLGVSALAGAIAPAGSGVLVGSVPESGQCTGGGRQVVLVRDPRGGGPETAFRETAREPVSGEAGTSALLQPGERLFSSERTPMVAALDEAGGVAGALVVPVAESGSHTQEAVLHWDGQEWHREPIRTGEEGVKVLAIAAASPADAWLLARGGSSAALSLYHRHLGGHAGGEWLPVSPRSGEPPGAALADDQGEALAEPSVIRSQLLTASGSGLWVDAERVSGSAQLTLYFKLTGSPHEGEVKAGESYTGSVAASWCNALQGHPACDHVLPESLPRGASRSFAWANAADPFGERVITGLAGGVSLRLEGSEFTRVLALGGSEIDDPGSTLGAAFSSPREGWLGSVSLPVHLTTMPAADRLTPVAVPFRHALSAVAAQPASAAGGETSEALAVGDQGEVARYRPGQGWQPESLLSGGGRVSRPNLRGVAWPTPTRAYAVGEVGQMWLWRGETGRWEADPAKPHNLRADLLGVGFDPNQPSRGYAVGQQGALLSYGKTWTQETALPTEAAGASFTSIAFAGSQAIVAFRQPHPQSGATPAHYTGGLLVNSGSGWQLDAGAQAALAGGVPWAVAGLPDGGAAVSAETGAGEPLVLERSGPGAQWQPTPSPYPGGIAPSSLALFREAGALRVIGSGSIPNTGRVDFLEPPPPNGFPPNVIGAYPAGSGYVIRQTPSGWSDEQHDRNLVGQPPPGEWPAYDTVYQPDPSSALLVDPSGGEGWAVGGTIDSSARGAKETADIARYQLTGQAPAPPAESPVAVNPALATFAIGAGAQCEATCADRANARIGPDVWLSSAISRAGSIAGVRDFLYLGPRVTTGQTTSGHTARIDYEREFARYAAILAPSPLPALTLATPTDLGKTEQQTTFGECLFAHAFEGFTQPLGLQPAGAGIEPYAGDHSSESCEAPGAQAGYYAFDSAGSGGTVRVIALDDSTDVGASQQGWLAEQLAGARARQVPAIVLGSADLSAQLTAHDSSAEAVARILVGLDSPASARASASAYFYDAPEENVSKPLSVGGEAIPMFGSGTLGYGNAIKAQAQDFIGHAGFLLGQVDAAHRDPLTNRAPVSARLIPSIGELALEAKDGTLLRRSQPALFSALARRPRAGGRASTEGGTNENAIYVPIPANCVGTRCAEGIFPEYTFSSSRPDIGNFVTPNLSSSDPHAVLLGADETPLADPQSGLFCAYNPGTTVVTITAGGLSASLTVTVQAGSVRRPCGTTPFDGSLPSAQPLAAPAPPPPPAPAPLSSSPAVTPLGPPPPAPPVLAALPPAPSVVVPPHPSPPLAYLVPAMPPAAPFAFVPPPVPTPARPTPPSGTSPVTSPIEVAEKEEEHEEAPETSRASAVAYRPDEGEPAPEYLLGVVALAAFAGAAARRRPRRGRKPEPSVVTVSERPWRRRRW